MAKESGLGMSISVDDSGGVLRDISNDIGNASWNTPQGLIEITGVDKSAVERMIGLSDGKVQLTGNAFNDAANASFDVFKTRTGTRTVTMALSGQTLSMEMLIEDVNWQRDEAGKFFPTIALALQSGTVPVWT